ncbi:AI-2E family transporter [Alphaproteobacteria bacterium]|nr:AI-2E family transporter [Alphaproteobacteria bacterium]
MLKELKSKKNKNLNTYIILFLFFLTFLYLFEVIIPFAIAFIISYLISPVKKFFDQYLNQAISSLLSVIIFILCFLSVLILISPIIIKQIHNLISILPSYVSKVEILINELNNQYFIDEKIKGFNYIDLLEPFTKKIISSSSILVNNSIQFFSSFFNIILILIISFYMNLELKNIKVFLDDFENKSNLKGLTILIKEIDVVLSKFIRGQGLICLILSVFYSLTLFFLGIEFGIILGLFAGMISFIPYVGAVLGGGLTLTLGFFQFGLSLDLFYLSLVFLFGQVFESYYLTPKLVGDAIGLNPIWILFSLLTGAHLAGFVGVLISLPVAAILGVIIRHYFFQILNEN